MMTGEKKCPHCGRDPDGCSVWSDADMGWVCEATGEAIPDGDPDGEDCPHCGGTGWQDCGTVAIECPECGGDGVLP